MQPTALASSDRYGAAVSNQQGFGERDWRSRNSCERVEAHMDRLASRQGLPQSTPETSWVSAFLQSLRVHVHAPGFAIEAMVTGELHAPVLHGLSLVLITAREVSPPTTVDRSPPHPPRW